MRIVTVLQTRALHAMQPGSSEFTPKHVQVLQKQIEKYAPFASFECISDVKIEGVETRKLEHNWPGWWAKMNMFSPMLKGDFLFIDLDTVIVGDLDNILAVDKLCLLRDFYRDGVRLKEGLGGALSFFPEAERADVWEYWIRNPLMAMRMAGHKADMEIMERFFRNTAARWQDLLPGQVVSHKVHCANGVPPNARIVCMHGLPRPWQVPQFSHLYR